MTQPYTEEDVQTALNAHYGLPADYPWPSETPSHAAMRVALDAVAKSIEARAKAQVLREEADKTIAETVCCDEYEAFKAGVARPKYPHHICYWGAAHAEALRARATEIEEAHRG